MITLVLFIVSIPRCAPLIKAITVNGIYKPGHIVYSIIPDAVTGQDLAHTTVTFSKNMFGQRRYDYTLAPLTSDAVFYMVIDRKMMIFCADSVAEVGICVRNKG